MAMKSRFVQIGISLGARIPKALLEQTRTTEDVQIEAPTGGIVIRSTRPREGWEDSFRLMAERGDDRLLDEALPTSFDAKEWSW